MSKAFFFLLSLSAMHTVFAASGGAMLFAQHCAACHGNDGAGGVGVPLALPSFLDSVPDDYLKKTIRFGRPGRVMPALDSLSEAQVDALVRHMRTWSKNKPPVFPQGPVKGNAARGQALYKTKCAACHGPNGEGGHGTGVTLSRPRHLPILAPALNNPGFLAAAPDAMIKATLMNGREGTPMMSFLKQGLTEPDIDDIVAFVRAFEKTPPPESAKVLTSESPVIIRESPYKLEETVENLKDAILGANFRLIRVQYLNQGFAKKGKENKKQVVVYSCNFNFVDKALKVDPRVGLFLPCRVTVVEHKGKVLVMSINPKRLSAIFNNSELNRLCEEMYNIYSNLIDEAVL